MITNINSDIVLKGLEFIVSLGWSEAERKQPQPIRMDVRLRFAEPPIAGISDNLADTYCYDALILALKHALEKKEFKLLEYLARETYLLVKQTVSAETQISIRIAKKPAVSTALEGVAFYYGDDENTW